ncbi:hypothetical protein BJ166DRAFT_588435 [Pestalotiopsis sp. NC0098]|nr:hypothetical protein BJ166DRAFT_588435 [Pestalotiopsis sp. NC0098]
MSLLRNVLRIGTGGVAAAGIGTGWLMSSTTMITPIPRDDPLWQSEQFKKLNRLENPVLADVCTKRIPLSRIRNELRDERALATEFARAVWSGWAFTPQRLLFTKKYRNAGTSDLIFDKKDIAASDFELGMQFLDQLEVVERTSDMVTVREGGSPQDPAPRELDGLITTTARIDWQKQEVELTLSTRFFRGRERVVDGSMPVPYAVELLHRLYARALVESGAQALV